MPAGSGEPPSRCGDASRASPWVILQGALAPSAVVLQEGLEGGFVSLGVPSEHPGQEGRGQSADTGDVEEDVADQS